MEANIKVVGKIDLTVFAKKEKAQQVIKAPRYLQQEIHFFADKNKKVVGRSSSGKIAIISYDFKNTWVKDGEDWLCDIISEQETKLIVMPIYRTVNAEENYNQSVEMAIKLKESGFNKTFTKPKNATLYYQTK